MKVRITVEGAKEVQQQLEKLIGELSTELPAIAERSGKIVETSAKEKAPVRTGALRDSITTDVETSTTEVVLEVGPGVDYADDVEFGNLHRSPKPYLRPAIDETEDAVIEAIANELNKLLEQL